MATNVCYWPKMHLTKGLIFLIPALVHEFLHYTRIPPSNIQLNVICILLRVSVFNRVHKNIRLPKILFFTTSSATLVENTISKQIVESPSSLGKCLTPQDTSHKGFL